MQKNSFYAAVIAVLCVLVSFGRWDVAASQTSPNPITLPNLVNPNQIYLPVVAKSHQAVSAGWLGLEGGLMQTVAVDPSDPNIVYMGSWGSGIYKSTDHGHSWAPARAGLTNQLIWSLAIDPDHPSVIYAGTHKSGVFKSTDGGNTWFPSNNGIQPAAVVYSIAIDPTNSNRILIGTRGIAVPCGDTTCPPWAGVVYLSTDAGVHWTPVLSNVGGTSNQFWAYTVAFDPLVPNLVFAALDGSPGLMRSKDGGLTWAKANTGISNPKGRGIAFDPTDVTALTAYYSGWQAWHYANLFKSTTGGDTWGAANNGIQKIDLWKMAMTKAIPPTLFVSTFTNGLLMTRDGGTTWKNAGVPTSGVNDVNLNPVDNNNIFAPDDSGLFQSTDNGYHWARTQTGLITTWATALIASPLDRKLMFLASYGQGVFQSNDGGLTWTAINGGLSDLYVHTLVMDPAHPNVLFALTDSAGLFRYDTNLGGNWAAVSGSLPVLAAGLAPQTGANLSYGPDYPFAVPEKPDSDVYPGLHASLAPTAPATNPAYLTMVFAPSSPATAYLGIYGSGVYKSTNGGSVWNAVGLSGYVVWSLAVNPVNPNVVYAATSTPGGIKVSTSGGGTWSDSPLPNPGLVVYSLAVSQDGSAVYAGTSNGVYQAMGGTWTLLGVAGYPVTAVAVNPALPGYIFAGTTNGGFFSADAGLIWNKAPAGLASLTTEAISFDPIDPYTAYFSTTANGVLRVQVTYP